MITITRRLTFCAGHRVLNHESKCRNAHGHNYAVFVTVAGIEQDLDELGRVVDFGVVKELVGGWIDERWDHGFIVFEQDLDMRAALAELPGQKVFLLPANPTAENLADYLLRVVCPALLEPRGLAATAVRIIETENCAADALREEDL